MRTYSVKQQQGSALVWLVSLTMIVGMLALVVDAYLLYQSKRVLQSQANSIASVLVNNNDACSINSNTDIDSALLAELERLGIADSVTAKADWVVVDTVDGRHKISSADSSLYQSNGASVILKKKNIGLLSFFVDEIQSSAVAKKEVYATFYTDGSLLNLNTANSALLGPIFEWVLGGNHLELDGVSFDSLANALIDVGDLLGFLTEDIPGVGNLLNGDVPLELIVEGILKGVNEATGEVVGGVDKLLEAIGADTNVKLGNVLQIAGDAEVIPQGSKIPALGLLTGLILELGKEKGLDGFIALDLNRLLTMPGSEVGLLENILEAKLKIDIDSPPKFVIAPARQNSDGSWIGEVHGADLSIELKLGLSLGQEGIFRLLAIDVPITVEGGKSTAKLVGTDCAIGQNNKVNLEFEVEKSVLDITSDIRIKALEGPPENCFPRVLEATCPVRADSAYPRFEHTWTGPLGARWGTCCYESLCPSAIDIGVQTNPQSVAAIAAINRMIPNVSLTLGENGEFEEIVETTDVTSGVALANTLRNLVGGLRVSGGTLLCIPVGELLNLLLEARIGNAPSLKEGLAELVAVLGEYVIGPLVELLGIHLGEAKVTITGVEQSKVSVIENCSIERCEI